MLRATLALLALVLSPPLASAAELVIADTPEAYQAEVVEASRREPILAMFDAGWCGPCRAMKPGLIQATNERGVKLVIVDISANDVMAADAGVQHLPTLVLFRGGRPGPQLLGAKGPEMIHQFLGAN